MCSRSRRRAKHNKSHPVEWDRLTEKKLVPLMEEVLLNHGRMPMDWFKGSTLHRMTKPFPKDMLFHHMTFTLGLPAVIASEAAPKKEPGPRWLKLG